MSFSGKRYRFTVEEYDRMGAAGIFGEDDRVELIEGEIVEMTPIGSLHASCVKRINQALTSFGSTGIIVGVQDPIRVGDLSEPQPDVVLVRAREDFYAAAHPRANDVLLLVEVADSSLGYDVAVKAPLYARAGIPEVWVVDLEGECIEVLTVPSPTGYRERRAVHRGEEIPVTALGGRTIPATRILGE